MMQDLSMSILDVVNNSVRAKASFITINIIDSDKKDFYSIEIIDNGSGMDDKTLKEVTSPFMTSRKTRKVGLGVPFFKELSYLDGDFEIESEVDKGTRIYVSMRKSHIDKPPLGDIVATIITLIGTDEKIDFNVNYVMDDTKINFDTREVKKILDGVSITEAEILLWLKNYLDEQFKVVSKN